ncbi:MAG TPA: hypothetical protein VIW45_02095, partial [Vicinamibacterales bacterium]
RRVSRFALAANGSESLSQSPSTHVSVAKLLGRSLGKRRVSRFALAANGSESLPPSHFIPYNHQLRHSLNVRS